MVRVVSLLHRSKKLLIEQKRYCCFKYCICPIQHTCLYKCPLCVFDLKMNMRPFFLITTCTDFTTVWQNRLSVSILQTFFASELDSRLYINTPLSAPLFPNVLGALGARWGKYSIYVRKLLFDILSRCTFFLSLGQELGIYSGLIHLSFTVYTFKY